MVRYPSGRKQARTVISNFVNRLPIPFELKVALYFMLATALFIGAMPVLLAMTGASVLLEGGRRAGQEAAYAWHEGIKPCFISYGTGWRNFL